MNENRDDKTGATPQEMHAILVEAFLAELAPLAAAFTPHFPQDKLGEVAARLAEEQMQIVQQMLPFIQSQVGSRKLIQVSVDSFHTNKNAIFPAISRIEECENDPQLAIATAAVYGLLLSPMARAFLLMSGYRYQFQFVEGKQKNRVSLT